MESGSKGHTRWYIPDGYIPPISSGQLESHESICVLNCNYQDALIAVTIYFEDRDPLENIEVAIPARRTKHVRTSTIAKNGESIPRGVPYAIEVESDLPVIVQYSRLDSTQAENSLMTTMAFPLL
ncbi:MAG: hypothetical protein A2189_09475 [Paenibacillus sp. RIFOXYA1_FULL_44_5]|nr:MAG: hypothetical protein A2189_09475 [Paenibacillus sp. RIFOXYA1_FULL_44_5]